MCPWASIRPGIAKASSRSTSRVEGPRNRMTSARLPTATIEPLRAARASAQGFTLSPVQIRLTLRIKSAGPSCRSRKARPGSLARDSGTRLEPFPTDQGHSVDEQVFHSGSVPGRVVKGCRIAERGRVEHDNVSAIAPARITPRSGSPRISAGQPEHERIACSSDSTLSSRA